MQAQARSSIEPQHRPGLQTRDKSSFDASSNPQERSNIQLSTKSNFDPSQRSCSGSLFKAITSSNDLISSNCECCDIDQWKLGSFRPKPGNESSRSKAYYTLHAFSCFRIIFYCKLGCKMMRKRENPFFATKVSTLK